MAAPRMEKTGVPGIYRRGGSYVVTYRDGVRQRKESCPTYAEAKRVKHARETDLIRGEFNAGSRLTFGDYAAEWIERYQGTGRGFRESTREDYRRDLVKYVYPVLGSKRLTDLTPRDLATFVAGLCETKAGKRLSDNTVRNKLNPVRACLATAVREGLLRHNPANAVALPHRPTPEDLDAEPVRALTREQLRAFLECVHPAHRPLFRLLSSTGLRIGEAVALQWRHLQLDGARPHVRVRRQAYRGVIQPPKTAHSRRSVPIDADLVATFRARRASSAWAADEDLVFRSSQGKPPSYANIMRRTLKPIAEEVGAPWAGFHTFRHTCASMLFERGANAKQVQQWLGHHSAAFTLSTYVHLLTDDLGEPLSLEAEMSARSSGNGLATRAPENVRMEAGSEAGVSWAFAG